MSSTFWMVVAILLAAELPLSIWAYLQARRLRAENDELRREIARIKASQAAMIETRHIHYVWDNAKEKTR